MAMLSPRRPTVIYALSLLVLFLPTAVAFVGYINARSTPLNGSARIGAGCVACAAKKAKVKAKKRSGGGGGAGIKGFGSSAPSASMSSSSSKSKSSSPAPAAKIDRSKSAMGLYSYLERNGAGPNLKRVALAQFPISDDGSATIRGVVAQRDIRKGEDIINVPYELAMNLGRESSDPTLPAVVLLREYCGCMSSSSSVTTAGAGTEGGGADRDDGPYMVMLPEFLGEDCLGSTDFFSDDELEALQSPLVVEETLTRRSMTASRYQQDVKPISDDAENIYLWIDGTPITEEHLRWAVWLITSRVLTVQGAEGTGDSYRLMIPLIDMCNHDRSSPHVLTGRAASGGSLRVVAGRNINRGEQINICYGGGVAGNDRFVQDYGFLDTFDDGTAFDLVAKVLSGKSRVREAGLGGKAIMREDDRLRALEALRKTTVQEDKDLLCDGDLNAATKAAVEYRLGMKYALERLGIALRKPTEDIM